MHPRPETFHQVVRGWYPKLRYFAPHCQERRQSQPRPISRKNGHLCMGAKGGCFATKLVNGQCRSATHPNHSGANQNQTCIYPNLFP